MNDIRFLFASRLFFGGPVVKAFTESEWVVLQKAQVPNTLCDEVDSSATAARAGRSRLHREEMIDQQPQTGQGKNWAAPDVEN